MKEVVKEKYLEHIQQLTKAANAIEAIKGNGERFTKLQISYCKALKHQIDYSKTIMNDTLNNTYWDNLVIAFFGETNAGKSTIIETLRILFDDNKEKNSDGLIVGNGRADFTQTYDEYQLSINGKRFTLIDVPGIEGEETDEFKAHISKALQKAHCVFYVHGQHKKPDCATAEKIKQYLAEWVSVYSIQNVRGDTSVYDEEDERTLLKTKNVNKLDDLINNTFVEILGKGIYHGNIIVQALLALCSKAHFSNQRQDLIKKQTKIVNYFGNHQAIFEFSNFQELTDLIQKKSLDFKNEIAEANKQKLASTANASLKRIKNLEEEYKSMIKDMTSSYKDYERDCISIINRTKNSINSIITSLNDKFYNAIKDIAYRVIDDDNIKNKEKEKVIKQRAKVKAREFQIELKSEIKESLESLSKEIERKQKDLVSCRYQLMSNLSSSQFKPDADTDEAIKELNISIKDALSFAGSVASGALAGSAFGPWGAFIGAAIGGLIHGIKKLFFSDGGKGVAKKKVRESIDKAKNEDNSSRKLSVKIQMKLDEFKSLIHKKVTEEIQNLNNLQNTMKQAQTDIQKFTNSLQIKNYGEI